LPPENPEPEPETPESRYSTPPSTHYSRLLLKKKSRIRMKKGPRLSFWTTISHPSHFILPTHKMGHAHFLQNGYVGFICTAYRLNKGKITREDIERAWVELIRGKFEEWREGGRLKERLVRRLGKTISQVFTYFFL